MSQALAKQIEYSEKYRDDAFEYRHVILPKELAEKVLPKGRLLDERTWRSLGIQQSRGWVHYAYHKPEPHVLLFRRSLGTDPTTGCFDSEKAEYYRREYEREFDFDMDDDGKDSEP
mmetsp:Transcript_7298/g.12724  ORF Transcript_7298/g.12724 Transcript_7298/m.12724 type:complete len:116 (+) Transcript_7298:317-664(+)|eukprot:CAMPEP_0184544018 /NCGR_PEP_ID=MMETSP0199_2-20130426/3347_1 /TAXON_ID=1112570 /ORGANISM="Thraustochytrium sp., Strain LLF1b" /LENGTH=115 /DNA_ID=CAMNT_0026938143 /DNA_START=793 /DNA_END=1140 /DNA_ORIENTATION=-